MRGPATPRDVEQTLEASIGFSASLNGASLADLVQMECLSGARCAARIRSGDDVGYLYFDRGRIVHATSPSNVGEAAALEILGWTNGSFEVCDARWPESESIRGSSQSLLMRAAQVRDESGRSKLVRFPSRSESPTPPKNEPLAMNSRNDPPPASDLPVDLTGQAPASGVARIRSAVRLNASGGFVTRVGAGADELADVAALATRLGGLIGDAFGLDNLMAIEANSPTQRTLIVVEKSGGLVAVRAPSDTDLAAVRQRYGL